MDAEGILGPFGTEIGGLFFHLGHDESDPDSKSLKIDQTSKSGVVGSNGYMKKTRWGESEIFPLDPHESHS